MDPRLPKGRCLPARRERLAHLREVLAAPGGAITLALEIVKFLASGALILATGVLLWMVG